MQDSRSRADTYWFGRDHLPALRASDRAHRRAAERPSPRLVCVGHEQMGILGALSMKAPPHIQTDDDLDNPASGQNHSKDIPEDLQFQRQRFTHDNPVALLRS